MKLLTSPFAASLFAVFAPFVLMTDTVFAQANQPPRLGIRDTPFDVPDDSSFFFTIGFADDRDFSIAPDGIVISIVPVDGRDDEFFSFANLSTLEFRDPAGAAPQDADGDNIYLITLRATDSGGLSSSDVTYEFQVSGIAGTPGPVLPPAQTVSVPINTRFATTFIATDDKDGVTYSLGEGTSAGFSINASTGEIVLPPQATPGIFTIVLRATDSDTNISTRNLYGSGYWHSYGKSRAPAIARAYPSGHGGFWLFLQSFCFRS